MRGRKHKLKAIYLVFVMIFVVSGCSSLIEKVGSINGIIKDQETYEPLAGAQITVGEKQIKTDQNGAFNMADLQLGTYQLIATLADYQPVEKTITVAEGSNFVGTFYLQHENRAPSFLTIDDQTVADGNTLEFVIKATDPDNDSLTYTGSSTTPGLADHFDPATQTFSWKPAQADVGSYQMTFTVSDGHVTATETVQITVTDSNDPPSIQTIDNQSVLVGETVSFTAVATDPNGDSLTYRASSTTAGLADYFDPATRTFTWVPTLDDRGVHRVIITVSDGELTATQSVTITVSTLNHAPVLEPVGDRTLNEDTALNIILKATDADNDNLTYSMTSPTPSLQTYFRPEVRTFSWTPTQEDVGTYEVTFSVTDGELTAEETIQITVVNVNDPPVLQYLGDQFGNELETISFQVVAQDQDGDQLTYTAKSLTAGVADHFDPATQTFTWTPTTADAGDHTMIFSVTDGVYTDEMTISIRVNGAPELLLPTEQIVDEGELVSFAISGTDVNTDDPLTYTCTTTQQIPGFTFDETTLTVNWLTDFDSQGSYELTFEVSDGHLSTTETMLLTVQNMDLVVHAPIVDMVASSDPNIVYGLNQADKQLQIINPLTRTVVSNVLLTGLNQPTALAYADQKVYILDGNSFTLGIFDEIAQSFTTRPLTGGKDIEVDPAADRIYILTDQGLKVVKLSSFSVIATAPVEGDMMVLDTRLKKLYTAYQGGDLQTPIIRYSVANDQFVEEERSAMMGTNGQRLALSPNGNRITLSCAGNTGLYDIEALNFTYLGEWNLGLNPQFIAFNPAGTILYGTNGDYADSNLYVMDANSYAKIRKLPFPNSSSYSIFTPNSDGTAIVGFSYNSSTNSDYRIYFFEEIQM